MRSYDRNWVEVQTLKKKPSIQKLFDAMQEYGINCSRASYNMIEFKKAQDKLKDRFKEMGIYNVFYWEDEEEDS